MTNREWLLNKMQNMSDERLADILTNNGEYICDEIRKPAKECINDCTRCVENWLKSEHKEPIKLSDAERVILENIDKIYKWIARDKDGSLHLFTEKPYKNNLNEWNIRSGCLAKLNIFNHLYKFIKWEDTEPYCIQDLLKGE